MIDWIKEKKPAKGVYIVTGVMFDDRDKPEHQCDLDTGDIASFSAGLAAKKSDARPVLVSSIEHFFKYFLHESITLRWIWESKLLLCGHHR